MEWNTNNVVNVRFTRAGFSRGPFYHLCRTGDGITYIIRESDGHEFREFGEWDCIRNFNSGIWVPQESKDIKSLLFN